MSLQAPISILIADDHPSFRFGIRLILEEEGFDVVAEASSAEDAVTRALERRPEICLLDVNMPGGGVSAAMAIRDSLPDTDIVMLTVSAEEQDLFDAVRAGASGYLLKGTDASRLPETLRRVRAGEAAIPRHFVSVLLSEFQGRERRRVPLSGDRSARLTSREWDVLELIRDGLSTEEIAQRLYVAPVTVRTHISAILKKLRAKDRLDAIRMVDEANPETRARRTRRALLPG